MRRGVFVANQKDAKSLMETHIPYAIPGVVCLVSAAIDKRRMTSAAPFLYRQTQTSVAPSLGKDKAQCLAACFLILPV